MVKSPTAASLVRCCGGGGDIDADGDPPLTLLTVDSRFDIRREGLVVRSEKDDCDCDCGRNV